MTRRMNGPAMVSVLLFVDFDQGGVCIPGSPENPCKVTLPLPIAERYVRNGMGQFCDQVGELGPKGPDGVPGCAGMDGQNGNPGKPGLDGGDGSDGLKGAVGMEGMRGRVGRNNNTAGQPGIPGVTGCNGEDGACGTNGDPGFDGNNGDPGEEGAQGKKGEPGSQGTTGVVGPDGMDGDVGVNGAPGVNGAVCPEGPIECIEIDDCTYRFITRDANCNILDDIIWEKPKIKYWCRETQTSVNFDAEDYKTVDNANGMQFNVPIPGQTPLVIDVDFGVPNSQPCRATACGHTGNPYETTHPNVNAYGPVQATPQCVWIQMKTKFSKPICGDLRLNFYDVDKSFSSFDLQCDEKVRIDSPTNVSLVAGGDIIEAPIDSGIFEPTPAQGEGNSDSDGSVTLTNIDAIDCVNFSLRTKDGFSIGFGFAGTQIIKTQQRGTYIGDKFYDENGNQITEPTGWVDCTE